jgi:iron complex transport system substrate-binding protein
VVVLLFVATALPSSLSVAATPFDGTKIVTDGIGRKVQVPATPRRIACFFGPSYEKVFLLGSADRVAVMSIKQTPWAHKLNPNLKKVAVMQSYNDPDVEKMLQLGVDLAFYWQWPRQLEKMAAAGIPAVCPYRADKSPATSEEFLRRYKSEIRFYGEVLGEEAQMTADAYCKYFDEKMARITALTARIPLARRPSVYYITGRNVFATQGGNTLGHWLVEMAGGNHVARELENHFVDVSMEQIIAWNPEIILVGGQISPDDIMKDPRWKTIRAVREKRVFPCPEGVFLWGHGSSELHLFVLWLAKILHPDLFRHINVEQEMKEYYDRFYHYRLTTDETRRILNRQPPRN